MARYFGVYLGRTSASVSLFQDGKWEMVANDAGDRVTPAVVSFTEQDELVGDAALHELIRNEKNTICGAKEFVGRQIDDEEVSRQTSNKIVAKGGMVAYEVVHEGKTKVVTPSEITEKVYKNLAETASRHGCDADYHDAVITAPVSFTCEQCDCLKEAAENAGFNVLRVISEPAAAVLAYGLNETDIDSTFNVLVYHLGGATLEVSVVQVLGGLLHVMSTVSDNDINGQALDDLLVEYLASEFQRQRKADCRSNKRSLVKLRFAAENCRKILSSLPSANCSVESLFDGYDFQTTLSRSRFDGLTGNFVQSCLAPIDEVLSQASLAKDSIHKVVLTGGCTKMPALQQKLQEFLPSATLLSSIAPDEVVAVGAAIQAGILGGAGVKTASDNLPVAVPCVSAAILCKVGDDGSQVVPIFQKFTPLPTHKRISLQLGSSQTAFALDLLEQSVIGNVLIGRVSMSDVVAGSVVEVKLDMDRDGNLCVCCTAGDKQDTINISIVSHSTAGTTNSH